MTAPSQPHILMCPPDFYGIHYEINPWMDVKRQADHAVAVEQWNALHREILNAGAKVSLLEPVEGLPDLVFTANAAMIFERQALFRGSVIASGKAKSRSIGVGYRNTASKQLMCRKTSASRAPAMPCFAVTHCMQGTACGATRPDISRSVAC